MPKEAPLYDGIVKITQEGMHSAKITIRAPFMRELGWRKGDTMHMRVVDGALVVRKLDDIIEAGTLVLTPRDRDAVSVTDPASPRV